MITFNQIKKLPKIELHRHLDGAVQPKLIFDLAQKNKIDLSVSNLKGLKKYYQITKQTSAAEFVQKFDLVISLMQTPENLQTIAYEQVLNLKKENILYAELRFAPHYHDQKGLTYIQVIKNVLLGFRKGYQKTGVLTNLIICLVREAKPELGEKVVKAALEFKNDQGPVRVVAIDLACDEANYPPERHLSAYKLTFNSYLKRTAHAGEFGQQRLKNIKTVINVLRADRLGHAIPLVTDQELMDLVKKKNIGIEFNPLSNLICHNIETINDLQIDKYFHQGIRFSINSDDPAMMFTSLSDNLDQVCQAYSWGLKELKIITLNTIDISFASTLEKKNLKQTFLKKWPRN